VLVFFTAGPLTPSALTPRGSLNSWLLPCGAMASVIVSAWLVEAKQRVIENMAPVLTASSPAFRRHPAGLPGRHDLDQQWASTSSAIILSTGYSSSCWACCLTPSPLGTLGLGPVCSTKCSSRWGFSPNKTAALGENGYITVTSGSLGDVFGRKKIFQLGLALFVVSCVLIALANNGGMVIAGRMIQGAAGATILACGLSLLSVANTGQEQLRAVSLWGAAAGQTIVVDGGQILPESL
jgi:hypothetical protein